MAARKEPMTKVMEMTLLIFTPMSWLVSKSFETARIAMPIFVYLIRRTRTMIRAIVRIGVMTVTRFVEAPRMLIESEIYGIFG